MTKKSLPTIHPAISPWSRHVANWDSCDRCVLSETRKRVCHARGSIPADVLFVGEAPGESEDVLGRPFIGPAGKLLDRIIEAAWRSMNQPEGYGGEFVATRCFTNLVGCIPRDEDGEKSGEPDESDIEACLPRLAEIIAMVRPRLVVAVGSLAAKWLRWRRTDYGISDIRIIDIVHPAAILRANIAQQGLMAQRSQVILAEALEAM